MNWNKFNTHGESKEKAFEILSNQIFKIYCEKNYTKDIKYFVPINGAGGDGGIESYIELNSNEIIAIQSKSFFDSITANRVEQIRNSIKTAISIRNNIKKYIVSVPRDLANKRNGVNNPEREKIENLFKEFSEFNIEFELWGEFELFNFLTTNEDLAGVYKFWFENSEISFSTIKNNFEIQKNGWLKNRYNEKLHTKSNINYEIKKIMGNSMHKRNQLNEISRIQETYCNYIELFEKFIDIIKDEDKQKVKKIYKEHKKIIKNLNEYIGIVKEYLKNENIKIEFTEDFYVDTEWFYNLKNKYNMLIHYSKMEKAIELIETINLNRFLKKLKNEQNITSLIVTGDLGTGKTHSIVNQVKKELERNNIVILIRASDIEENSSWRDILIKALGLSNTWADDEVFLALSSLAYRNEFKKKEKYIINNRILICIDGIDEHSNYDFWDQKQQEAIYLSQKYERLRFCFAGRPYAFKNLNNIDKNYCKVLNHDYNPGYDIDEMYNKYINEYKIKIENSINIRPYLNNPLVLKLFCQQYANKTINSIKNTEVNLSQLFRIKIEQMNQEFIKNNLEILCDDAISRTAKLIIDYLYKNEKIYQHEIIKFMNSDEELAIISDVDKIKIIKSLQVYGLLDCETNEEEFGKKVKLYCKGMQPVIDYIMALNLSNEIINGKYSDIDDKLKNDISVLQLTALILFEEKEIYLPDLRELNISQYILEEVTTYAIVNSNPLKSKKIEHRIKESLLKNPDNMRIILNRIIIPCSRITGHPLGAEFLNEILNSYDNMADRDKLWSIPEWLQEENLRVYESLIINKDNPIYFLNQNDKNNGLPIIYTWLLSRTNNLELLFYRNQLMKWALICPNEFVLLLDRFREINDIQILEQIYGVAMCLCYKTSNNDVISKIFEICKKTFFENTNIKTYDFQIRTYIRAIAEKANKIKILNKKELKLYIPPYNCKKEISLNKDAYEHATRMSGYKVIDYDLARYVLCDYLEHRFFHHFNEYNNNQAVKLEDIFSKEELLFDKQNFIGNKEYESALLSFDDKLDKLENILIDYGWYEEVENIIETKKDEKLRDDTLNLEKDYSINLSKKETVDDYYGKKTREFLEKEAKKINLKDINNEKFIIAGAYQYILNCGWNEEEFYGNKKIDSEILRRYYSATHGAKSNIMCFAEKYIWCYRNEIVGYLADNLYKNKEEKEKYKNYAEIDDVLIPITEYEQVSKEEKDFCENFLPEQVFNSKILKNIEEIKDWIKDTKLNIDLQKWIYVTDNADNKYITLNSFNSFSDIKNDIEMNVWITGGIINKDDIKYLKDNIECRQKNLYRTISNPDYFKEYTIADGAKTLLEIINFDWYDTKESELENISLLNNNINRYNIFKTYEDAYNLHTDFVEVHYKVPSLKIRKLLKINNNDGFKYKSDNQVVSFYETNNKGWDDEHNILVVKKELEKLLEDNNEKLIWFFRVDKMLSSLGREKYKGIYDRNEIVGICWFDNGKFEIHFMKQ